MPSKANRDCPQPLSTIACAKASDVGITLIRCFKFLNNFLDSLYINADIYNNIVEELKKSRIFDPKKINRKKLQKILFKLGYSNLYEHIPYIINKISNIPPPKITQDTEEKFYKMFKSIQEPWELYKPKGRKNIISYSYIIYKFCELLGLNDFLLCFPLLKSRDKLKEQDYLWKKICDHLGWEFIPSI